MGSLDLDILYIWLAKYDLMECMRVEILLPILSLAAGGFVSAAGLRPELRPRGDGRSVYNLLSFTARASPPAVVCISCDLSSRARRPLSSRAGTPALWEIPIGGVEGKHPLLTTRLSVAALAAYGSPCDLSSRARRPALWE